MTNEEAIKRAERVIGHQLKKLKTHFDNRYCHELCHCEHTSHCAVSCLSPHLADVIVINRNGKGPETLVMCWKKFAVWQKENKDKFK